LPVPAQRVGGLIVVRTAAAADSVAGVVVCARVSSRDQRADLDRRVAGLTAWVAEHDLEAGQVVCGVGPG
jgi:putative resolvase